MKTAQLVRLIDFEDSSKPYHYQWYGETWLPIVLSERRVIHDKFVLLPGQWRLKFVYTEYVPYANNRFYYGVRTDEYPLMWLWYWWKIRFDKSLELLVWGLVLSLEVWGLAKTTPGAKPTLGSIKLPALLKR